MKELLPVFGQVKLESIHPKHVRTYLDRRTKKISGNREIAVLSAIFNRAREWGYTRAANPCAGVRRNAERGTRPGQVHHRRGVSADFYTAADAVLRDAMALAYYTGQRVSDVLKIRRTDIRDGALWIKQGKTSKTLRIAVEGELRRTIEEITARGVVGIYLLTTPKGERVSYEALHQRFARAQT